MYGWSWLQTDTKRRAACLRQQSFLYLYEFACGLARQVCVPARLAYLCCMVTRLYLVSVIRRSTVQRRRYDVVLARSSSSSVKALPTSAPSPKRYHSHHPSLLHSLTPGSKVTFSTNPSHFNTSSTLDCHGHGTAQDLCFSIYFSLFFFNFYRADARYWYSSSVRLSVCPSVTFRY